MTFSSGMRKSRMTMRLLPKFLLIVIRSVSTQVTGSIPNCGFWRLAKLDGNTLTLLGYWNQLVCNQNLPWRFDGPLSVTRERVRR